MEDLPFEDVANFDPKSFVQDVGNVQMYPIILSNVSLKNPYQLDGAIEPLTIRDVVTRTSVTWPNEAHGVKGHFGSGNEDSFGSVDVILQLVPLSSSGAPSPYFDALSSLGDTITGSVKWDGDVSDVKSNVLAFDEIQWLRRLIKRGTLSGSDILSATLSMRPTDDGHMVPTNFRSAGAGFTFSTFTSASLGTDSIAFGGFFR